MVPLFATMSNRDISLRYKGRVSPDQVGNIRNGRSWSDATGIKPVVASGVTVTPYKDRRPNYKQTHPGHPLFEVTKDINDGISIRIRSLMRDRGILNNAAAMALQMTESAVCSKLYRRRNAFSTAQVLILHRVLFSDVDIAWLLAGEHDEKNPPAYAQRSEFYELEIMVRNLKREAGNVENNG